MKDDLKEITLIIHIAYGAILSSAAPWLSIFHNADKLDLKSAVVLPLSLLLLFFSAWLGGTILIKKYPYFSGEKDYSVCFFDGLRLLIDFIGIIALGIALFAAVQQKRFSHNGYEFDFAFFVAIYFLLILVWNWIAKISTPEDKIDQIDFAKGVVAAVFLCMFFVGYLFDYKQIMIVVIILKVVVDLLYLGHIAHSEHK